MTANETDILPANQEGEEEMADLVTVECAQCGQHAGLGLSRTPRSNDPRYLEFRGIVTCSVEGHEWPMAIKTDNIVQFTEQMMPVLESANLNSKVPPGLVLDIKVAERAHFEQLYRPSTVMCRRAVQLGLMESPHCIPDASFSKMLDDAKAMTRPPLSSRGFLLAEDVKKYGDAGAHRTEDISPGDARSAIFSAVKVLNELFP